MTKFRVKKGGKVVGHEYLTESGWVYRCVGDVERCGVMSGENLRREIFVTTDMDGKDIFEGDTIKVKITGGMYHTVGIVKYSQTRHSFCIFAQNERLWEIPRKLQCEVFSLVQTNLSNT